MVYGKMLNPRRYELTPEDFSFIVGATYTGTQWVTERIFYHINTAGYYRVHLYAQGGHGGAGSANYGGGGASRGNIGIHDIELAKNDSLYIQDNGAYLKMMFYHGPQNLPENLFLTLQAGIGHNGGAASITGRGDAGKAPNPNGSFNVLSWNGPAGKFGKRGHGGYASMFDGNTEIAHYTSKGQNGGIPPESPIVGPWILGLGGQGGPIDDSSSTNPWTTNYGGVVLEMA